MKVQALTIDEFNQAKAILAEINDTEFLNEQNFTEGIECLINDENGALYLQLIGTNFLPDRNLNSYYFEMPSTILNNIVSIETSHYSKVNSVSKQTLYTINIKLEILSTIVFLKLTDLNSLRFKIVEKTT